ncbi:MAG: rod shape-determining protein MreC [bacterium]|nr:rod shape-determining protein MreC [Myxococcales bacterium]MCB9551163.1 rod shape-determining protein MreC [Myxococcales bacterium]
MSTPPGASPRRAIITGALLLGLSLVFLFLDRRGPHPGPIGAIVVAITAPIQSGLTAAGSSIHTLWEDYLALRGVREENTTLRERVRDLQEQAARTADLLAENERLRRLLDLADRRKDLRLQAARVVARSNSPFFRVMRLEIDVDDPSRLEEGQPVIAPGGVVGQIRSLTGDRAEVLLVTDPRSAIDVVLETSRARGVAVGTGEPERYAARLEYLERSVKAVAGERVLTTGDDGRYPGGLVVGEVSPEAGQAESGPFQNARVRPLVDLGALEEVFIVLGPTGLSPDGTRFEEARPEPPPEAQGETRP